MSHAENKSLLVKLGALVAGLVVVGYVGLRLGAGDMNLPVPFLGSSEPAAHVVTPEEEVAAEIKAQPNLVTRDACLNLYMNAPALITMLSHPTREQFDAMSNDELRALGVGVVGTGTGPRYVAGQVLLLSHDKLVDAYTRWTSLPRFANPNGAETRRVNAYLDTCRSMYPARDEASANFIRVRIYTLIRIGFNAGSLADRIRMGQ
ncbi:hypothetical protein [Burkholderia vietnamiensis]|uniref:hypothetical protein n=1 Tax=Burkholderia vietnamiensis TaxID=60552 RepID=UPI001CF16FDB|nr:hypothetical protein [Burkholderia vietnamiensis]MCA8448854.1 hypothetical protein [Burkholderia vietnamiensis]